MLNNKLIAPLIAFLLGVSLCVSTSAENAGYYLIIFLGLFATDFRKQLVNALRNKYVLMAFIFYCAYILRFLVGDVAISNLTYRLSKFIFWLFVPLFYVGISANRQSARYLIIGFIVGAVFTAIVSDLTFLFKHPLGIGPRDGMSLWVVFHGHLIHNLFLGVASSIILHTLLNYKLSTKQKILLIICYLICVTNVLFIVFGRSGQIILLFTNLLVVVFRFGVKGIILSVLGLLILLPLLYFTSPSVRLGIDAYQKDQKMLAMSYDLENNSTGLRKEFHKISTNLIKEKPIIGYGSGAFETTYNAYAESYNYYSRTSNPHCDWLLVGVETGIVGMLILALVLLSLIKEVLKFQPKTRNLTLVIILGYFIGSLQNSFFTDNVTGLAFIVLIISLIMMDRDNDYLTKEVVL